MNVPLMTKLGDTLKAHVDFTGIHTSLEECVDILTTVSEIESKDSELASNNPAS